MTDAKLSLIDVALIGVYFLLLFILSIRKKKQESAEDFLLSGRKLTLPALVATLVSTWYGGILGVGEFTVLYGVSQWLLFAFPFYVFGVVFALFLAPKIREMATLTLPEALKMTYGEREGKMAAAGIFLLASPAPYILMVGALAQFVLGGKEPLLLYALVVAFISAFYTIWGGFDAVVRTDILQLVLMYGGFALLLVFSWNHYGGFSELLEALPKSHLEPTGGHSWQYMLVWFFIALWTLVDPGFHQRASAAESPAIARKGVLISVLCWMIFDFLTLSTGLFGVLIAAELTHPMLVYPELATQLLPNGLKGLFFVGILATIMSTMDSYFLLSGQTFAQDFKAQNGAASVGAIRLGIVLAGLIALGLIYAFPSVITLWYVLGSAIIPALLLPVLGVYQPFFKVSERFVRWLMPCAFLTSMAWILLGMGMDGSSAWLGVEPFYPGLLVSLLIWTAGKVRSEDFANGRKAK